MWHGMNGWTMGWGMIIFMILFWIFLLVGAAFLISFMIKKANEHSSPKVQEDFQPPIEPKETPLEILQKRYARGEINKQQYLEIKHGMEG